MEEKLEDVLTEKAGEAAKYAVMRSMPAFLKDLTDGGTRTCVENTMALRMKVRHAGEDSMAQVLDVSWLPRAKVKEKDFPEFRAGEDRQLELDFSYSAEKVSGGEVEQAEEDPGNPEEWKPLLETAREHGLAIYCPCRHGKANHMDKWQDGRWQTCALIPGSEQERVWQACCDSGIMLRRIENAVEMVGGSIRLLLELGETVYCQYDGGLAFEYRKQGERGLQKSVLGNIPAYAIPVTYPWPFGGNEAECGEG